jgi:hypothetical protein
MKELMKFRKTQNLPALPPIFNPWQKENHYLVPSIPETDFPCQIKDNVYLCGPILLPVTSVAEADPELETWLAGNPTVMINLGSHIRIDNEMIREFAVALKVLLDRRPEIQILWKLETSGGLSLPSTKTKDKRQSGSATKTKTENYTDTFDPTSLDAITPEIQTGRVKITEWMSVDPLAVLQSGHIICSVHHGGSNSFHEALRYYSLLSIFPFSSTLSIHNQHTLTISASASPNSSYPTGSTPSNSPTESNTSASVSTVVEALLHESTRGSFHGR